MCLMLNKVNIYTTRKSFSAFFAYFPRSGAYWEKQKKKETPMKKNKKKPKSPTEGKPRSSMPSIPSGGIHDTLPTGSTDPEWERFPSPAEEDSIVDVKLQNDTSFGGEKTAAFRGETKKDGEGTVFAPPIKAEPDTETPPLLPEEKKARGDGEEGDGNDSSDGGESTAAYRALLSEMRERLRAKESFDLIERTLRVADDTLSLFYIDGFVKDGEMQRIMQYFLGLSGLPRGQNAARIFAEQNVPYVEVDVTEDRETMQTFVLAGATLLLGSSFGDRAILIDARTYPARETAEPDNDRVMQGAHDGFVETLIFNTALIRRRIRDPRLTMYYASVGEISKTDVVLSYIEGKADPAFVELLKKKLARIRPKSLTLGYQSLIESLVRKKWYNPFPKFRTLERPDAAAAELCEGRVLLLCDTSPVAIVLPTSIFDFMQETDDYYLPPITGSYLRLVRHAAFLLALILTPLWYLLVSYGSALPVSLQFLLPKPSPIPILVQLFLVEFAIDGLKLASMNTPNMLTNSLSVIGGLILGDYAVSIGWLSEEVILYMAIVAIASFTQQNHELGYAFKFLRLITLILTALFGLWGFIGGLLLALVLVASNKTVSGKRSYLYPLIPFDGRAFLHLFFRVKKHDFEKEE